MNNGGQNSIGHPALTRALAGLVAVLLITVFASTLWPAQLSTSAKAGASSDVRFELPNSVEMQERAGLTVQGTFFGLENSPSWIARPSEAWIQILLRDNAGKILIDRPLRPPLSGQKPDITPTVVYSRLGFPFEVLSRCDPLPPGRYSLEIRYDSPASKQAVAISKSSVLALTVRSNAAVPLRHLSLEVPGRVVFDDFRARVFGLSVRVLNDGCEAQTVIPFSPESVSVEVRNSDGRIVSCLSPASSSATAPITLMPMKSWVTFIAFSGRCDIPLPSGAYERTHYRAQVSYRGPGWTDPTLRLDKTVDLELANLPHSSPNSLAPAGK